MPKPLIELYEFSGIGLIIGFESGVRYTNQVGGYSCDHPEMEGVLLPLTNPLVDQQNKLADFFTGPKWRGACDNGIDEETANFVEAVLRESHNTNALRVNRAKLAESQEAWIHVIVSPNGEQSLLWSGFDNAPGILTWENSD